MLAVKRAASIDVLLQLSLAKFVRTASASRLHQIASKPCFNPSKAFTGIARRGIATAAAVDTRGNDVVAIWKNWKALDAEGYGRFSHPLEPAYDRVFHTQLDPIRFLERSARMYPDKKAIVIAGTDRTYTYGEFGARVRQMADALLTMGLRKGEKVAVVAPNCTAILELHYSVPLAGGILVPINTRLKPSEVAYIVKHSHSRYLFVDAELESLASESRDAVEKTFIIGDTGKSETCEYEALIDTGRVKAWWQLPATQDEYEIASICYTSGTTGNPKGCELHKRGAYLNSLAQIIEFGMTPESKYLWTLPIFHCSGWCFSWAVTASSSTHVLLKKIDYDLIWDLFKNHGISHYCAAPTVNTFLVHNPHAVPLEKDVRLMVAGSPPSPTLLSQLNAVNIRPLHVYGLTEVFGPMTLNLPQEITATLPKAEQEARAARQGNANIVSDEVRVVEKETMIDTPMDGKTMGEVVIRGNTTMRGYYNDAAATAKAFKGGWFHSGDIAVRHPDGYIEIMDREKDVIISGGENISTVEIENCIMKHPKVLECAVIAVPDHLWGERPKAFITLKPEYMEHEALMPGDIEREIIDHCRANLANFKCPSRVEIEPDGLPKTGTGKITKFVLREREWKGKEGKRVA